MRVIRTPSTSASKQDQRADEIRRVHSSYTGFICPLQSADTGDQVGMVKQMALGASLTEYSSSELLKETLLADEDVIPLERVFPEQIHEFSLTNIMVNGDWIGCCFDSPLIIRKYKELRRSYDAKGKYVGEPGIDPKTTIYWDTDGNEINFWTDAGRMMRPMLVVRNNGEFDKIGQELLGTKYDTKEKNLENAGFVQDITLSKEDVQSLLHKGITIETLHQRGIIDYISPEEMENCYIAPSLDELKKQQFNPLQQYTHCEIPPALLGIPALTCPYMTHNQAPRITFQTNQSKQTCGWYCLNWPYRIDKHAFLQYYCETPLIKTVVNSYLYPNGVNSVVAILCYGGYNQEDSLIFNKAATERGIYKGRQFNVVKKDLEKGEHFGNPDEAHTLDIKKHANYEHLVGGFVKRGTIVHKDDVVMGSYIEIPKPSDQRIYKDTSVLFPYNESAMIESVVIARNQDEEEFAKVKFSSVRTLGIGDKFSSRAGQKGMAGLGYNHIDMCFSMNGIIPDLLLNPHAIPSRMTIGQLIEGLNGKVAAIRGSFSDATAFTKVDLHSIGNELEELGYDRYGVEPMCNGMTGEWIDVEVFICPTYYQRLQKFVVDEVYSISTGPTCVITRRMACLSESVMIR